MIYLETINSINGLIEHEFYSCHPKWRMLIATLTKYLLSLMYLQLTSVKQKWVFMHSPKTIWVTWLFEGLPAELFSDQW